MGWYHLVFVLLSVASYVVWSEGMGGKGRGGGEERRDSCTLLDFSICEVVTRGVDKDADAVGRGDGFLDLIVDGKTPQRAGNLRLAKGEGEGEGLKGGRVSCKVDRRVAVG